MKAKQARKEFQTTEVSIHSHTGSALRQSFSFDTEDTGPAYTQMQIQHRPRVLATDGEEAEVVAVAGRWEGFAA